MSGFRFRVAAKPVAGLVLPSLDMDHRTFSCLSKAYVPMLGAERKHAGQERGGRTAPPRDGPTLKHVLKEQSHTLLLTFTITGVYALNKYLCDWCGRAVQGFYTTVSVHNGVL